jgi:hypothetical protein
VTDEDNDSALGGEEGAKGDTEARLCNDRESGSVDQLRGGGNGPFCLDRENWSWKQRATTTLRKPTRVFMRVMTKKSRTGT